MAKKKLDLLTSFHLETWAGDDRARVIVCDYCGCRGDVMSIEWNFDTKAKAWEPQERHLPKCGHITNTSSNIKGALHEDKA